MIELALMCLSLNVYHEARGQSIAGQVAVAQVTMNRVHSPKYPDDVCSVVYEHKQFSWYGDGESDAPKEEEAWERAQAVASGVLAGSGHAELESVLFYHAVYVSPYWADKMQLVAQIEDHIFYSQ